MGVDKSNSAARAFDSFETPLVSKSSGAIALIFLVSVSRSFGNVLRRENRHDLKLDLTPPVAQAIGEVLETLGPTLAEKLGGEDAVLYECAALISDPRAPHHRCSAIAEHRGLSS